MLRPYDIAPQSVVVTQQGIRKNQFSADRIQFMKDGNMKIQLAGIKNDYDRDGFEIIVVKASQEKLCPVITLKAYLK